MEDKYQESNANKNSLDAIPKINVFKTPEDYFQKLPLKIQLRLKPKKHPMVMIIENIFFYKFALKMSVISVLIMGIIMTIWYKSTQEEKQTIASKIEKKSLNQIPDLKSIDTPFPPEPSHQSDASTKKFFDTIPSSNTTIIASDKQLNSMDITKNEVENSSFNGNKFLSELSKEEVLAYLEEEYSSDYEWEEVSNRY